MSRVSKNTVEITIDGVRVEVVGGSSVAAVILNQRHSNRSPQGPIDRGWIPLCGMGVCWGCRATIDGRIDRRACLVSVANGMTVQTSVPTQLPEVEI